MATRKRNRFRGGLVGGNLLRHARELRKEATGAERKPWAQLRGRHLEGFRFRRQYPIEGYISDFCCLERKLVIEIDGVQHSEQEAYDAERTRQLALLGFRVLRFWNGDVLSNVLGVVEEICRELRKSA